MSHVDALSRSDPAEFINRATEESVCRVQDPDVEPAVISHISVPDVQDRLSIAQARDPVVLKLRTQLETELSPDFLLSNGIVFKKSSTGVELLYVPNEMEENVIRLAHESVGHQGVEKTKDYLLRCYWMPQLGRKIEKHIQNCLNCIMYASPARSSQKPLHMIPKIPLPFDTIHLDHFGPLPSIKSKRKHILVIIDAFTKFVKLYPTNSTSTKEVNCALEKYFQYYCRPRRIVSDRGSCFTSAEFQAFILKNSIDHVKIATAAPWANGQVERTMRQLKSMLGKLTEPYQHSDWTNMLTHAEFAINNSRHSTTGASPAVMLFGTRQRSPCPDRLTDYLCSRQNPSRDLDTTRAEAGVRIQKYQDYVLAKHGQKATGPMKYNVGDFVVIKNVDNTPGTNKKLIPIFRGPYIVHKTLDHDRYVIRDIEGCQQTQIPYDGILEASRLHKWVDVDEVIFNNDDLVDDVVSVHSTKDKEESELEAESGVKPKPQAGTPNQGRRNLRPLPHRTA